MGQLPYREGPIASLPPHGVLEEAEGEKLEVLSIFLKDLWALASYGFTSLGYLLNF